MEDSKFWMYIIFGVVYFLFQFLKKRKPEEGEEPTENQDAPRYPSQDQVPPSQRPRQLTFEELLREITEAKTQTPAPTRPEYVDYDDDIPEEAASNEKVAPAFSDSDSVRIYEQAKAQAFARPSLEQLKPEFAEIKFEKFKSFEAEKPAAFLHDYIKELRDPDGFRKAFVMSEILTRKHF
jgi:hypothetical protein